MLRSTVGTMAASNAFDRVQRRWPPLGFPIAVGYKFFDDIGGYLAALITYYAFVSLIPLLLLASTIFGIVLAGHPDWQQSLLDSALAEFPVIGEQLKAPKALSGGPVAMTIGVVGALYGAQGVAQALQYAANTVWQVPRNDRPNPVLARGRSMLLVATIGLGLIATTALGTFVDRLRLAQTEHVALVIGAVAINTLVFATAFRIAAATRLRLRSLWVGALLCGIGWYFLQNFGALYVDRVIRKASTVNSVFAVVLGLLAYIYLASLMVVLAMEVDVVRVRRLYPRALLTPFTDNVDLTGGDVASYTGQAKAQRAKGFQRIDVRFDDGSGGAHPVRPEVGKPSRPRDPQD